jgi:glutamine amidotransferase
MNSVAIVDYGMCNLDSVARAVEECGYKPHIVDDPNALQFASHIILPGVGAFSEAMESLSRLGFDAALREKVLLQETPLLGICLGMQLLATRGYEGGEKLGLNLIPGEVCLLKAKDKNERVPHIGWNEVYAHHESLLFQGIQNGKDFYFVHSYHFLCDPKYILAKTAYADGFNSAVGHGRIFGVQFHPEKSQRMGFSLLTNFLRL